MDYWTIGLLLFWTIVEYLVVDVCCKLVQNSSGLFVPSFVQTSCFPVFSRVFEEWYSGFLKVFLTSHKHETVTPHFELWSHETVTPNSTLAMAVQSYAVRVQRCGLLRMGRHAVAAPCGSNGKVWPPCSFSNKEPSKTSVWLA